jgi:drug/metabolite transporter (DMT)-like permease
LYILPIGGWSLYHTNFTAFSPSITAKVLYILFFTSFLVYLLNSYAVKKAGPTLAGLYIYLQPVLATIIAVFLGTDHLTPTKTLLMAFIMGGVYLATRFSPK